MVIFDSSKKNALRYRRHPSNVFNKISSEIIHYKSADDKLMRESLQHQSKEAILMIKSISVENTTASCLEKWQGQKTRADDLSDELSKAHHSITLLQNKLNKK